MYRDSGSLSLQPVERAWRPSKLLVRASQPLSVREIAARLGINRTTAHRVRCIGAAIRSATGDPLFAISLTGPSTRFTNTICAALGPELVATAVSLVSLSERFGYRSPLSKGLRSTRHRAFTSLIAPGVDQAKRHTRLGYGLKNGRRVKSQWLGTPVKEQQRTTTSEFRPRSSRAPIPSNTTS